MLERCPFCESELKAIESRKENLYAGGCDSPSCPIIFRTKAMYDKLNAVMTINDLVRKINK